MVLHALKDGLKVISIIHASGDFHLVPSMEIASECEVMNVVKNSEEFGTVHIRAAAYILKCDILSII